MNRVHRHRRGLVMPSRERQRGFIMAPYRFGGGGGGTMWTQTAIWTLTSNSSNWSGYTLRQFIPTSGLANGYKIRLTLTAPPGNSVTVSAAYLQTSGTTPTVYSYSGTPIQVTFSGSTSVTIPAGGSVVTDEIVIGVSTSVGMVFGANISATANMRYLPSGATGWSGWFAFGARANVVSETAYSSLGASSVALVSKVEVWT